MIRKISFMVVVVCFIIIPFTQILAQAAPPAELPQSGQTTCYDASGNQIACTGTGEDGALQEGVAWPSPRFTDNGDETITDNLTGLMWTQNANAPGSACTPGVEKTWQDALNYVACLNTNSYLGYSDWRLPNVVELESLVDPGQVSIASWLNTQGFSNVQAGYYWSSTTEPTNPTVTVSAEVVHLAYGSVVDGPKSNSNYVWAVR
jgi:hypothetical protein